MPESAALAPGLSPAFLCHKRGIREVNEDKIKEALCPALVSRGLCCSRRAIRALEALGEDAMSCSALPPLIQTSVYQLG